MADESKTVWNLLRMSSLTTKSGVDGTHVWQVNSTSKENFIVFEQDCSSWMPASGYVTISADMWCSGPFTSCDCYLISKGYGYIPRAKPGSSRVVQAADIGARRRMSFTFAVDSTDADWSNTLVRFDNNGSLAAGTDARLDIDHVMVELGDVQHAYAPAEGEALPVGGGWLDE